MSDFPVFRPNVVAGDADDFLEFHPVPKEPDPDAPPPDPAGEAFLDARRYASETPFGGRGRSMNLVDRTVCKFPCNIPGHNHNQPVFVPEPELDEVGVGWTTQHIPLDPLRSTVAHRCVLCWSLEEELALHECQVLAVVNG